MLKVLRLENPAPRQQQRLPSHAVRWRRSGVQTARRLHRGSGDRVHLMDFADAQANDWLAVNPFAVIEGQHHRRPVVSLSPIPEQNSVVSILEHTASLHTRRCSHE